MRRHKDSGLEYLRGKHAVLFSNGVKITPEEFDQLKGTAGAIKARLDECLAGEPAGGWDWKYARTTGQLRSKRGNGGLVPSARTSSIRAKQRKAADALETEEQKKTELRKYLLSSVFLVTVVMAVVGVGSAIMSAYHTTMFLYTGGKPMWASLLTGAMLILFSGTAFTAARYFFQEKGALAIFGWFFVVTGLAVIAYSMFSTLTVNFNQFKWKDDQKAVAVAAGSETLAAHSRVLDDNAAALDEVNAAILRLEGEADWWRSQSWRRYDEFSAQLTGARERRDALRAERTRLEAQTPSLVEQASASQDNIYTFLARLTGLPQDVARFFVYIVPACLYDILAPFALSVVLLLTDRRRKQRGAAS